MPIFEKKLLSTKGIKGQSLQFPTISSNDRETKMVVEIFGMPAVLDEFLGAFDMGLWLCSPFKKTPPFLVNFDNLAFPLHSSLLALPKFFLSCYTILFYCWLVRRKEWPHFFRFHVSNALLLGSLVQVIGTSSGWVPLRFFPPHFWSAATFLFLVTVSECIRCALCGVYPSIPFVKDAALLHSDLKIR